MLDVLHPMRVTHARSACKMTTVSDIHCHMRFYCLFVTVCGSVVGQVVCEFEIDGRLRMLRSSDQWRRDTASFPKRKTTFKPLRPT